MSKIAKNLTFFQKNCQIFFFFRWTLKSHIWAQRGENYPTNGTSLGRFQMSVLKCKLKIPGFVRFGANLKHFFVSLTHFGANLIHSGANLTHLGDNFMHRWANLTHFGSNLTYLCAIFTHFGENLTHFVVNLSYFMANCTHFGLI